ncbi:MAG: DNA polymerase III subunit gamma/tau [Aquificaceae bacterium]|nr:MAG: DNA polymerase III subunit gamma/tau [Aquificaceae bacterium]
MSYQVLARRWRPQNFAEMVGQQHVRKALINALDGDRLHHAYLFTGTRGVGKTTIARILAKCLNCETGVTSEPCGSCSSCVEIAEGRFVDLIEVDAASRTKVEDTRELLDNVQYAPTRGRFKVYLIDEVHMLSGHSFNALLKTLEEPPPHVKFLFATTDPQKLPVTILSRCLQFNLKRMPVDMISRHLVYLLSKEEIKSDDASLRLIARGADGSMRDALSLLDQAISFGNGELKEADVREMLGTISHEPLLDLLSSVAAGDGEAILDGIEQMAGVTPDFEAATDALITLLHKMAVLQVVPQAEEDDEAIKQLAQQFSREDVQLYYQIALHGRRDLPLSPDPRSGFEMIFLRLLTFRPLADIAPPSSPTPNIATQTASTPSTSQQTKKKTLATKASTQEAPIKIPSVLHDTPAPPIIDDAPPWGESITPASETPSAVVEKKVTTQAKTPVEKEKVAPIVEQHVAKTPEVTSGDDPMWHEIVPQLGLSGRSAEIVKHCILSSTADNKIVLSMDSSGENLLAKSAEQEIETALQTYYNKSIHLQIKIQRLTKETPAERIERQHQERQKMAEELMQNDSFVQDLQNRFNATLVPNSVKPK